MRNASAMVIHKRVLPATKRRKKPAAEPTIPKQHINHLRPEQGDAMEHRVLKPALVIRPILIPVPINLITAPPL